MSDDLRNSILLWAGAILLVGLFSAALHFDIGPSIPDRWLWPMVAIALGLNVLGLIRAWRRRRRTRADGDP